MKRRHDRVGSCGGGIYPLFGATKWNDENNREMGGALAFGGCRSMIFHTIGIRDGGEYEGEVCLGGSARRGCLSIVLAASSSNHIIKLKYIVELTNSFFLCQIVKLDKTLAHRPRPTPSAEAPRGGVGLFAIVMPLNQQTATPWWWCLGDG